MSLNSNINQRREWMPAYAITILITTTFLLSIRLISRFNRLGGRLGIDDVFIVLGWMLTTGMTFMAIYMCIHLKFDRHFNAVPIEIWPIGAKWTFVTEILVVWAGLFIKLAVLLFYRRLVDGTASLRFKIAIWIAMVFVVVYTIIFTVLILVQCRPISQYWNMYDEEWLALHAAELNCPSVRTQFITANFVGAFSVFTDWYSVMLPAVLLLRIRMNKTQKYGLLFIFGLGYSVVAAGIVRTYYLGKAITQTDKPWVTFNVEVASIAELNIGIICACAPSLKTVTGRFFREMTSFASRKYSSSSSYGPTKQSNSNDASGGERSAMSMNNLGRKLSSGFKYRRWPRGGSGKELDSFVETHEYGLEEFGPVAQGYEEKVVSYFKKPIPQETRDIGDDNFETQLGQDVFLDPSSPPPGYEGDPVPSAKFIIRPQPTASRSGLASLLSPNGRSGTKNLSEGDDKIRFPLSSINSATPSVVFINNEEDEEELVRVRYHSFIDAVNSDDDAIQQELSFPRMNPDATRTQSMRDHREFGKPAQLISTVEIGRSQGTQTSPRQSFKSSPGKKLTTQLRDEAQQQKGSVRRAIENIRVQEAHRNESGSRSQERSYENDKSHLESPSGSELSFNDDFVEKGHLEKPKASVSETAIIGTAKLTNIHSSPKKFTKANGITVPSPSTALPVVALNTANRVFSPVSQSISMSSIPGRPGTAPTTGSVIHGSKPLNGLSHSPSISSSAPRAIGLSTSITQSSAPRSPSANPFDMTKYGPQSYVTAGEFISNSATVVATSTSTGLGSGRVSPLFSRGRKPSDGKVAPGSSIIAKVAGISGGPLSATPGSAIELQSNDPFHRPNGFGLSPTPPEVQSSYKYRFYPSIENGSNKEIRRSASEDHIRNIDRTWIEDLSTESSSSQSGSGIGRAKVRPVKK